MEASSGVSAVGNPEMPAEHQHSASGDCCKGKDGELAPRMPTVFDVVKSGMLMPMQGLVDAMGVEILKSRDDKGHLPAHWACLAGHTTVLRYIIEMKAPVDEPGDNDLAQHPIHWACVNGHVAVVDILLQAGVNIDVMDNKGCTPLIVACQYGKTILAGYLLGKGARTQIVDKDGDTALHWAAFKGHSELCRLLVFSGFNSHQRDNYGQVPLHLACISGDLTSVKEFCEVDTVELDVVDKNGKTPLMLAMGRKHQNIVAYLKKTSKKRRRILPRLDPWTIIFGPPGNTKGALVFFVVMVLFWGYPMYIIKCLPYTWYDLQELHIFFMTMNVLMWISLYHASTTDPGFLPQNVPEYDRAIKEVAHFDEWKHGRNPLSRLCHTCRCVRPLRSKHCRYCNRCVAVFDHHCPYIYNCVGVKNRVWFVCFVGSVFFLLLLGIYFLINLLQHNGFEYLLGFGLFQLLIFQIIATVVLYFTVSCGKVFTFYWKFLILRVSFVVFSLSTGFNGLCSLFFQWWFHPIYGHLWYYPFGYLHTAFFDVIGLGVGSLSVLQAAWNLTTNERLNRSRYDYLKDGAGNYYNPFNRGWRSNILEFLHLKRPLGESEINLMNVNVV